MDDQMYYKILSCTASQQEKEVFYNELKHDKEKEDEFARLKTIWDLESISQTRFSSRRKKDLFREFWNDVNNKSQGSKYPVHTMSKQNIKRGVLARWHKYAAVIVLTFAAGFFLNSLLSKDNAGTQKQFHTQSGSISAVTLDDGSKIWLNSNTTLVLNEKAGEVTARLEGEAWFEITHDPQRIFKVNAGKIKVLDQGTVFNISAYPGDELSRVTLFDGKITVLDENDRELKILDPGQTFRFDNYNNIYAVEYLDPLLVSGWTENKFVFIDLPLSEICKEIEKWYGVSVIIKDSQLAGEKYSSVIRRTTTVRQLMEMLKAATGTNYQIEENGEEKPVVYLSKK